MTSLLPLTTIRQLTDALIPSGLATSDARAELLQGIHVGLVASLPLAGNMLDQVRSDLAMLNQIPALEDGQVPLRTWLENAVTRLMRFGRVEAATFHWALDELATILLGSKTETAAPETLQPAMVSPLSSEEVESLKNQLANRKENLRLIEERKAEYVEETAIPLQLISSEKKLRKQIAEVERKLAAASAV